MEQFMRSILFATNESLFLKTMRKDLLLDVEKFFPKMY